MKTARFACWILFLAATLFAQPTAAPLNRHISTVQLPKRRFHAASSQVVSTEKVLYSFTGGVAPAR